MDKRCPRCGSERVKDNDNDGYKCMECRAEWWDDYDGRGVIEGDW